MRPLLVSNRLPVTVEVALGGEVSVNRSSSASIGATTRRASHVVCSQSSASSSAGHGGEARFRLFQISIPSREKLPTSGVSPRVDELIGRVYGAFSTVDCVPTRLRPVPRRGCVARHAAARRMNLVAKEFVTCRTDEDGVLVPGEFAGAAAEMG